jgi:hypothetical protein
MAAAYWILPAIAHLVLSVAVGIDPWPRDPALQQPATWDPAVLLHGYAQTLVVSIAESWSVPGIGHHVLHGQSGDDSFPHQCRPAVATLDGLAQGASLLTGVKGQPEDGFHDVFHALRASDLLQ